MSDFNKMSDFFYLLPRDAAHRAVLCAQGVRHELEARGILWGAGGKWRGGRAARALARNT